MRLYVTPASPWVRRVRVTILELGIEDRFEFVQTRWPHSWGTQTVAMPADFTATTPVMRIPAMVTDAVTLTDSHAICDYLNAEFGQYRLLAREGAARWQALATMALANAVLEAQIMRRAETLRADKNRSTDFITKMRDRTFRCFAALEQHLPSFGATFDLAQIT
ncbi:MAG: glutathione S-transferase family protein, partial [Reyranellales bacterium]